MDDLFTRLERERLEADRLYNEALTLLDQAIGRVPDLPPAPPPYDDSRLAPLNLKWNILPRDLPQDDRSLKGRLRRFIWRLVGPPLEAQRSFNSELVDHINRNAAVHRQAQETAGQLREVLGRESAALVRFESLLLQYLRMMTLYIDTKDRSAGGSELRERLSVAEQRMLGLKRELEDLQTSRPRPVGAAADGELVPAGGAAPSGNAFSANLDSPTYVGFEDRFRGTRESIRARVDDYLPVFASASDVVDVGCGRGELLDLFKEHGVRARGVDSNHAMVELCRGRGLEVEQGDALGFLERQQDESLGGLVAIQVVEHFDPKYLLRFLEVAHHKLRAGAPIVLETINPACWMAFFECYLRDVTHRQALHPDTLRYLVQTSGFSDVDVHLRQPVSSTDRLERVPDPPAGSSAGNDQLARIALTVNAHADKLNARLFSSMDYAVVARRGPQTTSS